MTDKRLRYYDAYRRHGAVSETKYRVNARGNSTLYEVERF